MTTQQMPAHPTATTTLASVSPLRRGRHRATPDTLPQHLASQFPKRNRATGNPQ